MNRAPSYFADLRANIAALSAKLTSKGWDHKIYCTKQPGWKVYYANVYIPESGQSYNEDFAAVFMSMFIKIMHPLSKQLETLRLVKGSSRRFKVRLSYTEKEYEHSITTKLEEL